ncbi:MAG: 4-hydroxy-3-methylbut-2-en-1-yl diphosphate synthase [Actinobacteria bacterium]|nr:MAG: 4-hydroxy-3-methylbut-2-en-1-yl diphosphate synthase [Actinomycetota bacterium]
MTLTETLTVGMVERRKSRQIQLGRVAIGGDAPVSVQSMTTTKTADIDATLQQIASLVAAGVDIVRVAVPHWEDAEALVAIAAKSTVPVVADIHFQWKYAIAALEAGVQGLRINPGNIKISVKHSSPKVMIEAYRMLAEACDYPLHLGVTEAGPMPMGGVKSAVGIGTLLADGIGDTIRVSLTDDPVEEVKVGNAILQSLGLRKRGLDLVACPSCGRAEIDVLALTKRVEAAIEKEKFGVPMRVAVMGCVVNGPGEAREADVGIASGNGLGFIIRQGEVVAKVGEDSLVDALLVEARKVAAEKAAAGTEA